MEMKHSKKMTFVRWGNLNPRRHKEHRKSDDFHVAPVFKGIYAFPMGHIEPFLLGGVEPDDDKNLENRRVEWLRDDNGELIGYDDFWDGDKPKSEYRGILKRRGIRTKDLSCGRRKGDCSPVLYVTVWTNRHKFEYGGEIWHHLGEYVDHKDILSESGSWVKTDIDAYAKALKQSDANERFDSSKGRYTTGDRSRYKTYYAQDHYEVFIEKLK